MNKKLTRRTFLGRTGAAAVGFGLLNSSAFIVRAAEAASRDANGNVWVFILLRGGADGLSICAPYGDPEYYQSRPNIALPRPRTAGSESLIDLDGHFGLHPALEPLMKAWSDRRLTILHAAGSREMTRSHFDAQEFLETGTPGIRGSNGWMDRCLHTVPGANLMQGVALAPLRPRVFLGDEAVFVTQDVTSFEFQAPGWKREAESRLREIYNQGAGPIVTAGRQALGTLTMFRRSTINAPPSNGARYPVTPFGSAVKQTAQVIKANFGTRCIFINFESAFDTHSNQIPSNQTDYANLAESLAAFYKDLGNHINRVVVLVASEFGRTVAEDGSRGTDHGTGGAMLLLGNVRGGRVAGRWPGLEKGKRFEERDLDVTTDFRDVLIEIASRHLGISNAGSLFPNYEAKELPGIVV